MASPTRIDIESLLQPIPGDNPAGVDLRNDASPTSVYYKIKDARAAARAAERTMDADGESAGLLPEWKVILDLGPKILSTQSKDLEITAWYVEALLRAQGYAGLRDGFKLTTGLVATFWDNLYPEPDEDGIATRVAPLAGLSGEGAEGTLIQPIRKLPITSGSTGAAYASWHYEQARETAKVTDKDKLKKRLEAGFLTMDKFDAEVKATPAPFWRNLVEDLAGAMEAYRELNDLLSEKAGHDAPSSANVRNALEAQFDLIKFLAGDRIPKAAPAAAADDGDGVAEAAPVEDAEVVMTNGAGPVVQGGLRNREDAFDAIMKIAEFLRKLEPQSVLPQSLEEVVRRGRMTLPELLAELLPDEKARKEFLLNSGIKPR